MTRKTAVALAFAVTTAVSVASTWVAPANAATARRPLTASLTCPGGAKDVMASARVSYSLFAEPNIVASGTLGCHERQQLSRGNQEIPEFTVTIDGFGSLTVRCAVSAPGPLPYTTSCGGAVFTIE